MTGTCFDSSIGERYALYHGDCVLALPGRPITSIGLSCRAGRSATSTPTARRGGLRQLRRRRRLLCPVRLPAARAAARHDPGRFAIVHRRIASSTAPQQWCAPHRAVQRQADDGDASARLVVLRPHHHCHPTRVRENNQTNNLPYSEPRRTPAAMASGCPEYLLLFRRP